MMRKPFSRARVAAARRWHRFRAVGLDQQKVLRFAVVLLSGVMAIILWLAYSYQEVAGDLQSEQDATRRLQASRHADRLRDKAAQDARDRAADTKIRDLICTAISLDPRARKRLLPLLPAAYAKQQCRPVGSKGSAKAVPSPGSSAAPAPRSSAAPSSTPPAARRPATGHASSAPQAAGPRPAPTRAPVAGSSPAAPPPAAPGGGGVIGALTSAACTVLGVVNLCSPK